MILSPAIAEKVSILAETDENLLPLFPVMERAVIIALKRIAKNVNKATDQN